MMKSTEPGAAAGETCTVRSMGAPNAIVPVGTVNVVVVGISAAPAGATARPASSTAMTGAMARGKAARLGRMSPPDRPRDEGVGAMVIGLVTDFKPFGARWQRPRRQPRRRVHGERDDPMLRTARALSSPHSGGPRPQRLQRQTAYW